MNTRNDDDEIYLTYKSCSLRKFDVECLGEYNRLNDMVISFYYEILNDTFKLFQDSFVLLDPVASSTIIFDNDIDDLKDMFYTSLSMSAKKYLFLPVNDNTDRFSPGGGDHWALIVYESSTDTYYYLDSMLNYIKNTDILCTKIHQMAGKDSLPVIKPSLTEKFQTNSWDCGMFVLGFTESILNFLSQTNFNTSLEKEDLNEIIASYGISSGNMKEHRKKIISIIDNLKNKNYY